MTPGPLNNLAEVRWTDPAASAAVTLLAADDARVGVTLTDAELSATGFAGLWKSVTAALVLLALGGLLVVLARRRDEDEDDVEDASP